MISSFSNLSFGASYFTKSLKQAEKVVEKATQMAKPAKMHGATTSTGQEGFEVVIGKESKRSYRLDGIKDKAQLWQQIETTEKQEGIQSAKHVPASKCKGKRNGRH